MLTNIVNDVNYIIAAMQSWEYYAREVR